ncbi:MAG: hypothetical protein A2161_02855 [Candidatus Schekmanbacteria bacterium RBG_13_48_7]|uniref:Lipoprotein n=1 Tax=Candidatus Schekmanbacteria bacterium RBG_13_48_7 TaxID=1817878 RepID=A0A1F7RS55_9BACT|nr:MAG: hypothetical protein A2161_02855 [Candidatus Schekmanbacteria bacterium RBG_13_48_7]
MKINKNILLLSMGGLSVFISCAYLYDVKIQPITNQEFAPIQENIPIQFFPSDQFNENYHQKIAVLKIVDPREYQNDIHEVFRTNALERFKKTARSIGAQNISFINLKVEKNPHSPGDYEIFDRFGKKVVVHQTQSFETYKYSIECIAIRNTKFRP